MDEKLMIAAAGDYFTVVDETGVLVRVLVAGDVLELYTAEGWQVVQVCSGGYKGWYYLSQTGRPGRFALCMKVRLLAGPSCDGPVPHRDWVALPCALAACESHVQTARLNAHFFGEGGDSYALAA